MRRTETDMESVGIERLIALSVIIIFNYFTIVATKKLNISMSHSLQQLCNWKIAIGLTMINLQRNLGP